MSLTCECRTFICHRLSHFHQLSLEDAKKAVSNDFMVNPVLSTVIEQPRASAETVAAGARGEPDGPASPNQSAQRQPSSTKSDGQVVTETIFIQPWSVSTANGSCHSYKRHPGHELLKMSVDEVFVGIRSIAVI